MKVKIVKTVVFKKQVEEEVDMNSQEYIAYIVTKIRKERYLSQEEFAQKLGVTRTSVSNIEAGRQGITLKMLEKICAALDCKSGDILYF